MRWGKVMNLQTRSREEPEINLTSLIDVVLLLLVFFMITTSFVRESKIGIRLPEASSTSLTEVATDTIVIAVTAQGVARQPAGDAGWRIARNCRPDRNEWSDRGNC